MNRAPSSVRDPTESGRVPPPPLPFSPLDLLAARSRRLADLVEAVSRRRDVRELRARLLVLLLELRCPHSGRPKRSWYVPGAVCRMGVEAIRRAWRGYHRTEPPCARTIRAHLGLLEQVRAVVRQPGDWVGLRTEPREGGWRPRHADTIHVLEDEESLEAWVRNGAEVLRSHPEARRNPDAWARLLSGWRRRRPARQLGLFDDLPPEGLQDRVGEGRADGRALASDLAALPEERRRDALQLLLVARAHGVEARGRPTWALAADRSRLEGGLCLLARALVRGDCVRNRAAWLVRAHRLAPAAELEQARLWVLGYASRERADATNHGRSPP